ncbi:MAG: putative photosynthetic complex assembly protein PuhE [Tabrizicola sp.]|jgi:putative photosynthetic complex assembly protein 2|nr:putative photosynthetic complex assembly protein PuhE [Tabrizicola sp.]
MTNPWAAALVTLFLWWFSTGAILWRVRHADRLGGAAHANSVFIALPLLLAGIWGLGVSLDETDATGTYIAFLSALAVWGWIELAFLSGVITGPNTAPCPPFARGWDRFWRATLTLIWHEALLIAALLLLTYAAWNAPNPFGLYTFALLFFARASAKLNLFLGVPRINVEFLPRPLSHLASHFAHARMNWLFPVSVTALTFASGCWLERAISAPTEAALIGHILLAVLTALALLEHWFMVLPLPDQKLWRWMLPDSPAADTSIPARK